MPKKMPATTTRELMQMATLIQNPSVMPRKVGPEEVFNRRPTMGSLLTGVNVPDTAEDVAGNSTGVARAKRAKSQHGK